MRALAAGLAALFAAALLAAALLAAAAEAAPRVELAEIEAEVMCPVCGTLLELADSPQAQREKAYIKRLISRGMTRSQVKDALVAQYGRDVLAVPEGSGFDLTAFLVPAIGFLVGAAVVAASAVRWRRRAASPGGRRGPPGPSAEDAERLDADISRYDL